MLHDETGGPTEDYVKDRITNFLRSIPSDDVIQIAKTSTSGLIRASNAEEAIAVILRYSDAVTLLNRRKIKTSYLANYLHKCHVQFSLPANKTVLSRHVLQHWGINGQAYEFEEVEESSELAPIRRSPRQRHDSGVVITPYNEAPGTGIDVIHTPQLPSAEQTGQALALQFVPWFYKMLNSQEDFHPHHFWDKCKLRLEIIGVEPTPIIKEVSTGEETCALLKSLVVSERILFNYNSLNGVGIQGRISPHGLVEVIACGSAHRDNSQFGWFDQMFSLMRDPHHQNNFKIWSTILVFRKGVTGPSLMAPPATDSGYNSFG